MRVACPVDGCEEPPARTTWHAAHHLVAGHGKTAEEAIALVLAPLDLALAQLQAERKRSAIAASRPRPLPKQPGLYWHCPECNGVGGAWLGPFKSPAALKARVDQHLKRHPGHEGVTEEQHAAAPATAPVPVPAPAPPADPPPLPSAVGAYWRCATCGSDWSGPFATGADVKAKVERHGAKNRDHEAAVEVRS